MQPLVRAELVLGFDRIVRELVDQVDFEAPVVQKEVKAAIARLLLHLAQDRAAGLILDPCPATEGVGALERDERSQVQVRFAVKLEGLSKPAVGKLGLVVEDPFRAGDRIAPDQRWFWLGLDLRVGLFRRCGVRGGRKRIVEGEPGEQSLVTGLGRSSGVGFAFPFLLGLAEFVVAVLQCLFGVAKAEVGLDESHRLFGRGRRQTRRWIVGADAVQSFFRHVVEEGIQPVEFPGRQRVEFVVVALGAPHRHAEPDRAQRAHPVHHVFVEILVRVGAAFVVGHVVPDEPGGDALVKAS